MSNILSLISAFLGGGAVTWITIRYVLNAKYKSTLKQAEAQAEVIQKNKMLEVKEKFLSLKADLEKQVNQRNARIQAIESKLKQRELQTNQRLEELQRKKNELAQSKENLDNQLEIIEKKKVEMDKLHRQEVDRLEALSGLSADEAKERLIESLKEEAKTEASSYINE
ncbi:MAG: DUF3552 domain-containing protein, partial [Bacteroidales bacterium]|nr:DUF3552 domain-containing protein [Bacteroidales bacterium]